MFGVHFAKSLETLQGIIPAEVLTFRFKFFVVIAVFDLVFLLQFVKWRHTDVNMAVGDKSPHISEKEREKNRPDVSAVLVGIGKDNYLVIFKVIDVEVVAEPRAQCAYKRPKFLVFKDFVD